MLLSSIWITIDPHQKTNHPFQSKKALKRKPNGLGMDEAVACLRISNLITILQFKKVCLQGGLELRLKILKITGVQTLALTPSKRIGQQYGVFGYERRSRILRKEKIMKNRALSAQTNSVGGIIELHSTCPISKIQTVSTNFYSRMTKEPPFLWKTGQKPSIAEAKKATSLVNDALKKLEKKATEEEIQTAYFVLSSGLKSQLGSDEKSTSVAYFYALDGVSSWVLQTATKDALKGKRRVKHDLYAINSRFLSLLRKT
ncbi:hypothetical protein m02_11620 [Bartonella bovis m02]|uniref:Uncharacterized protein n=1 Tax=Bartonella bovis m02 TaxID=1094492 RepID=N6UBM2_9HYPH|nr:hypothetical protein m02_11620 [Bartonella bovis m02]